MLRQVIIYINLYISKRLRTLNPVKKIVLCILCLLWINLIKDKYPKKRVQLKENKEIRKERKKYMIIYFQIRLFL